MMLYEIMKHTHNFFNSGVQETKSFKIENGSISLSFVKTNQYFLIENSTFNDGVYKYPATNLIDEEFSGTITALNVPKSFIDLATEIETFVANDTNSAYTSESFGGYSYTRATNSDGSLMRWQDVFKQKLNSWRKI